VLGIVPNCKALTADIKPAEKPCLSFKSVVVEISNRSVAGGVSHLGVIALHPRFNRVKKLAELGSVGEHSRQSVPPPRSQLEVLTKCVRPDSIDRAPLSRVHLKPNLTAVNSGYRTSGICEVYLNIPFSIVTAVIKFCGWGIELYALNDYSRPELGYKGLSSYFYRAPSFDGLLGYNDERENDRPSCRGVRPSKDAIPTWRVPCGIFYVFLGLAFIRFSRDRVVTICGFFCAVLGGAFILTGYVKCQSGEKGESGQIFPHNFNTVTRKQLTSLYYCNTLLDMANMLSADKQTAIVSALAEGSSIRSIERITGVHRDTIMRLGVKVGQGCTKLMDSKMQDLDCNVLQFDELWGFIGKKERHVSVDDNPELGDVWTYCAIDSETKLVPSFKVGKRTHATTTEFVQDVASRMRNRVQVSSDAMHLYAEAMELAFGSDVDYGQCVKVYTHDAAQHPERKYSAPHFASAYRRPITGNPDMELVSTSHVERLNATTRLHMRRLTRLTLAFSKKLENFEAAVGLHFAYYNFVKRHNTLRCTPAMAAGVERDFWSVGDLVEAAA
jgi:IS1 family transposase